MINMSFLYNILQDKKPKASVMKRVNQFRGSYYQWLSEMEAEETPHPWDQFEISKTQTKEETSV